MPLRELVPVAQPGHAGPHLLAGRAQQLEDVQQLLQLAVSGEDGLLRGWGVGRKERMGEEVEPVAAWYSCSGGTKPGTLLPRLFPLSSTPMPQPAAAPDPTA